MHLTYKTMRILQLHTKMVSGGIEAIVCGLANEMSKSHDVTMCTIFQPNQDDVFYEKLASRVTKHTIGKKNFGFSVSEIFKIFRYIKDGNFDVVHVHGCFQYYFLAMLLLHKKVKFFYTIHSDAKMENQKWDWKLFKLKRFMFAHRWVTPVTISNASQASFTQLYHCPSELVYNGTAKPVIDNANNLVDSFRYSPDTQIFIHAGRISQPKNQIVLCRTFKRLVDEGWDVVLLIAGSAENKDIYNEISCYFSDRIVYLGERSDVPSLFAQCDAFCLPSIWEGLPVSMLEALSVGCVPICSPVGGIPDVIKDGENGILSKSSSLEDYYYAVMSFISMSKQERKEMCRLALNSFQKYDIEDSAKHYLDLYEKTTI